MNANHLDTTCITTHTRTHNLHQFKIAECSRWNGIGFSTAHSDREWDVIGVKRLRCMEHRRPLCIYIHILRLDREREGERGYEGKQDRQTETEKEERCYACCLWYIHQFTHAAAVCITDQLTLTGAHAGGRRSALELLRLLLKRP